MSQNTMRIRTSFNRARGRALLKGGGNVTGMLPGSHDYGSSRSRAYSQGHMTTAPHGPHGLPVRGIALNLACIRSIIITLTP